MKKITLTLTGLLTMTMAMGQPVELQLKPEQITGPMTYHSPEVASLGKFAMSAPNLSNGQVQHNIPLFTVSENGIQYPVALNYGFSGFKPRERPNAAGMGWSVSEGSILRIVKGLPDENAKKKYEEFDYNNPLPGEPVSVQLDYALPNVNYDLAANRVLNKMYDPQPDEYIYNFNGYSGRFIWVDGGAIMYPHADIKISQYTNPAFNGPFFKIETPDGIEYHFRALDETYNQHHWNAQLEGYTDEFFPTSCGDIQSTLPYTDRPMFTAWRIIKVENVNTKAQVTFEYDFYLEEKHFEGNDCSSVTFYTNGTYDPDDGFGYMTPIIDPHPGYLTTKNYYLKKITTANKTWQYKYKPRADFPAIPGLDSIKMFSNLDLNQPLFAVNFDYYTPGSVHFLKNLSIYGNGEEKTYQFTYNSTNVTSPADNGIDHWGYANGKQNQTLVPRSEWITLAESSGAFSLISSYDPFIWADRTPDFNFAKNAALKEITYPTGGKSTITYESAGGRGIRVKTVSDYDQFSNTTNSKHYSYFPDNLIEAPMYFNNEYRTMLFNDYCPSTVANPNGFYARRYMTFTATSNSTLDFFDQNQNFYSNVVEYLGSPSGSFGKNEYNFIKDFLTGSPLLTSQTSFDNNNNIVKKIVNTYQKVKLRTIHFWGNPNLLQPPITQACATDIHAGGEHCDGHDPYYQFSLARIEGLSMSQEQMEINWYKKTQTQETDYSAGNAGSLENITKCFYQPVISSYPKYLMPNKIEKYLSNGDIEELRTYFVNDPYPVSPGVSLLGPMQMWQEGNANYKHMTAFPMKMIKSLNGTKKEELNYEYVYNSSTDEVNLFKSTYNVGNEVAKTATFGYAKGDRVNAVEELGIKSVLLRDYNQQFVTSRISNASATNVAYIGFEGQYQNLGVADENKGNWDFDKNLIVTSTPLSGKRAIALAPGGSKIESLYPLEAGKKYTLTFWTWSSGCQVKNGTSVLTPAIPIKTLNGGWQLNSYTVTGNGSKISISTSPSAGSTVYFDEVRLMPETASMESYSYDWLGNVTSRCDNRNVLSFYSYDSFGRLEYVKDEWDNIIEKSEYKLQQP
ncbi:MAG: hypothetical protein WC756_15470 [Taibaiella sp.]|jgi:hypothetical protein